MANSIVLKGNPYGISVIISDYTDYEETKANLVAKFKESESFFKGASVGISFEGVKLADNYQVDLLKAIADNTSLDIACLIDKDESTIAYYKDIVDVVKNDEPDPEELRKFATVIRKDIAASGSIDSPLGVVVYGNLLRSGKIVSGSDVTVFGECAGEIVAGYPDNKNAVVFMETYKDCKISIGGITDTEKDEGSSFFKKKKKKTTCIKAYIIDDRIHFEEISN